MVCGKLPKNFVSLLQMFTIFLVRWKYLLSIRVLNDKTIMIIKVCGLRDPDNIQDVVGLGIDMAGFIFDRNNPRYVSSVPSCAGLLPDYASIPECSMSSIHSPLRVGVFGKDMPQNIITMAYNYKLDYVQLYGMNDVIMIDNLRRTLCDDICHGIKFIKAIGVSNRRDVELWREYKGIADMLMFYSKDKYDTPCDIKFDWGLLNYYDGDIPFLVSGGIGPDDVQTVLSLDHPYMAGIDINSMFEVLPAMKDISLLKQFISRIRNNK